VLLLTDDDGGRAGGAVLLVGEQAEVWCSQPEKSGQVFVAAAQLGGVFTRLVTDRHAHITLGEIRHSGVAVECTG
jgi:hypothetical protein